MSKAMTRNTQKSVKTTAMLMVVAGVAAMILPFYVGLASTIFLGFLIAGSGMVGMAIEQRLYRAGSTSSSWMIYAIYILLGLLLILFPKFTLGLAALILGGMVILNGLLLFRSAKAQQKSLIPSIITLSFGGLIILLGASGIAWIIGFSFGLSLILQGIQLWWQVQRIPTVIDS